MKDIRLKDWNYSWNGKYFITINTLNMEPLFGHIEGEIMYLNEVGKIAESCWKDITNHYKHILLDEFVIMPNHIPRLITIEDPNEEQGYYLWNRMKKLKKKEVVEPENPKLISNQTLYAVVGSFKSSCTKRIRAETDCKTFKWLKRFNDQVIFNKIALMRIRQYIADNPKNYRL